MESNPILPQVSDGLLPLPVDVDVILWLNPDMDGVKPALVCLGRCLSRLQVRPLPFHQAQDLCRSGLRATGSIHWQRSMKSSAPGGKAATQLGMWPCEGIVSPGGGRSSTCSTSSIPVRFPYLSHLRAPPKRRAQWRSLGCDGPRGVAGFTVSSYLYAPKDTVIVLSSGQDLAYLLNDG